MSSEAKTSQALWEMYGGDHDLYQANIARAEIAMRRGDCRVCGAESDYDANECERCGETFYPSPGSSTLTLA